MSPERKMLSPTLMLQKRVNSKVRRCKNPVLCLNQNFCHRSRWFNFRRFCRCRWSYLAFSEADDVNSRLPLQTNKQTPTRRCTVQNLSRSWACTSAPSWHWMRSWSAIIDLRNCWKVYMKWIFPGPPRYRNVLCLYFFLIRTFDAMRFH